MTGMGGSGLETGNSLITDAFGTLMLHQLLVVFSLFLLGSLVWMLLGPKFPATAALPAEPRGRAILRYGLGILWILDAYLQTQSSMPLGLPDGVLRPSAATSPSWVQHLVNHGALIWQRQPIHTAVAVIWIQLGIGLWLIVAKRGWMSRLGAMASIAWALSIWSAGTGFGAIFASGSSLLFGSPGSSFVYAIASAFLVVPMTKWSSERFTIRSVKVLGGFFVAMGVLQAWPGRGTWAGFDRHHQPAGQIVAMAATMAQTPQPHVVSSVVSSFATLAGDAPVLVNALFVVAMVVTGVGLLVASKRSLDVALVVGLVFCAVTWIFVEDFGFFGGVGTDPNTMPVLALLLVGLVLGVTRRPDGMTEGEEVREGFGGLVAIVFGSVSALIVLLGAIPLAQASVSTAVDPLLAQAINTPPQTVHFAGLPFTLTDQRGHIVTSASLKGKVVALTFLDPVCVSDCPTIAREMAATDALLGTDAQRVALVAINANPAYNSVAISQSFTEENGLGGRANWYFLTGDLPQLQRLWAFYDVQTSNSPAGAMTSHNDITYLLDTHGTVRLVFASTPGNTGILHASYSAFLAEQLRNLW